MLRLTHRTSRRLRFSLPPRNLYSLSSNSRAQNHTECKNEPRNLEQVSSSSINDLNPHSYHPRDLYSSSSSNFSDSRSQNHTECKNLERNLQQVSSSSIVNVNHHSLSSLSSPSRSTVFLLSATVLSATATAAYLLFSGENTGEEKKVYSTIEDAINRSNESAKRIIHRMKQTGAAAAVLWQSLRSVMSSANYEVRLGFEFRVAAFLADIAAANASRRAAIVAAGGGKVVDWLLEMVAAPVAGDRRRTQAEAARALAYLIADSNVNKEVLGRPHAVANILRFIFFSQPQGSKKNPRPSSFDVSDSLKGRSMLVAAVMDIVTSSCESLENIQFLPTLPAHAEMRDIAAAIQVIEGGMHLDDPHANEDEGGSGLKGIGIKVLGETTILGLSRTSGVMKYADNDDIESSGYTPRNVLHQKRHENFLGDAAMSSPVVPGLWDDLHSEHVAVPFATWALANWAMASQANRSHIQDLDHDGHAIKTALAAPERSVKWHGSLVARFLLEDDSIQLNDFISDWSSSLLSTISQACKSDDIPLAQVALSAFLLSLERSPGSRKAIMDKGLDLMRNTAKRTTEHKNVQESLAKALELICTDDLHLPLEESQKWSGILLSWACRKSSPEKLRSSAIKILSGILEDFGPASIPISQGWLTILLTEVLNSIKTSSKGGSQPKSDKVKTQLGQLNIQSAGQIASQLTSSVVNLAAKQLGPPADPVETFPLAGFLSQEPFAGPFKSLNKDRSPKFHAADAATATLKGIKALAEVCAEDPLCQNQISDSGVLCLLRRFLMKDDYEKLAAIEAYDASVVREAQEPESNDPSESTVVDTNDTSSVRVPPSSHIRRHAARLLTILSALPKVQKVIIADKTLCKWLEDCATGLIPGCSDVKIQSYARATLLNVLCTEKGASDPRSNGRSGTGIVNETRACRRYDDMIFLINPSSPHWKCPEKPSSGTSNRNSSSKDDDYSAGATSPNNNISSEGDAIDNKNGYLSTSNNGSQAEVPPMDVIFIHGMRGGPFKTWRISEDKSSTKSGLVERIDQEAGKQGTFWPGEWLSADFPDARLFTLKYKTNLTQWSGASLPLQEVSSMLLEKIVAAGIGNHPVVFVTHSMGGLIVKQMLYQAKAENLNDLVNNTVGVVFYSCPHFGSKLADLPWRMGLVLRPAPTIGELRSGSPRLVELNDFMRRLHKKGSLEVLSFSETKVTPLVEGYGGWAFRMEIVPIESAYPGYGDIVVLESTDHINSCKPLSRDDPSYTEIVEFLRKLKAHYT